MDDSQEPSYYEIALTNRQVLVFFVVLLVCVVGAFFSGIWLGQQRAGELPTLAEVPADVPVESGESETLAELNFFTDEDPAPAKSSKSAPTPKRASESASNASGGRVAAAGDRKTTLLEDLNGSERSEPSDKTPPDPAPRRTPPPSPKVSAPAPVGGFVIQVFSSPDGTQARKVLDRLTSAGYQAFISPVEVDGRTMHRVRVGPYVDKNDAVSAAAKVEQAYSLDTWVTSNE